MPQFESLKVVTDQAGVPHLEPLQELAGQRPTSDGTVGHTIDHIPDALALFEDGVSLAEIVRTRSAPGDIDQLAGVNLAAR